MSTETNFFSRIPLCVPVLRGNEWAYVKECLDDNWVSSVGRFVISFEESVASYVGAAKGIATVNGTAAIHVSLLVAGLQPDEEVLVSTLTFIAPVNAIRYCGAWPVFVDAEPVNYQMDIGKLRNFLEVRCVVKGGHLINRKSGRRVRAIMPVHILGHPVDMAPLLDLAKKYGLMVIEDATESLGATYRGSPVGTLGDIGCFSFNGNKLLTTGGGGMIVTNDTQMAERAFYLTTQAKDDGDEYIHGDIGYNYRLTNIQAAIGCAQMEQIAPYLEAKIQIAARYAEALADVDGIVTMDEADWATSAWWMYTIQVLPKHLGIDRRAVQKALGAQGIETRPLWMPAHLNKPYIGSEATDCQVSRNLHERALCLPCSVDLSESDQDRVIDCLLYAISKEQTDTGN